MTIRKNTHAPFRLPHFYLHHKSFFYQLQLTDSCKYRFGNDDDNDINKLFGVAFITWASVWFVVKNLFKGKLKALHHYNSIRYGWRYDALSNRFELWKYCYINGNRTMNYIQGVNPNEKIDLKLEFSKFFLAIGANFSYYFLDDDPLKYYAMPANCLMYTLHPYFGGNRKAPHDMIINLKRL